MSFIFATQPLRLHFVLK